MINIIKKLEIKNQEAAKIWFINIDKICESKNAKILYLSFENMTKIMNSGKFEKMPDPLFFMSGVTYQSFANRYLDIDTDRNFFSRNRKLSFARFKPTHMLFK